jgi:hypothetical protein
MQRVAGRLALTLAFSCAFAAARVCAQTRVPDSTHELRLFESTERDLDPLGLDDSTGKDLDEAARKLAAARAKASRTPPPVATRGEVLSSIEGVSETSHQVELKLDQGLAFVRVRIRFESRSSQPAELAYRLALPLDAAVSAVRVCQQSRCSAALPVARAQNAEAQASSPSASGPQVSATHIVDARGPALALRAASVAKDAPLGLEVDYVAAAELRGGVARFRLPARGYDPRAAPSQVTLSAPALASLDPESGVTRDPWQPLPVRGALAEHANITTTTRARCGNAACARSFEASAAAPPSARETWLWLDASPSMEGPARNRADLALSALLSGLPEQTRLRVFAFAARGREIGRYEAGAAPLKTLSDALSTELGAASQPRALYDLTKNELGRVRPRLILLSDGKLDKLALRDLQLARERGAELWLIDVGSANLEPKQVFDGAIALSREADEALSSGSLEPLDEALRVLLGPRAESGRRRGEQRVREQGPRKPYLPLPGESWLSFWMARAEPPDFRSASSTSTAVIPALAFENQAPRSVAAETGMPKESVLSMLRTQLVPQARACLRVDRKGRADYAVGLVFHALFAEREAYDVRVEGKIAEALRECLGKVVQQLRIPAFSGRIRVRYPIHTEREPEPPVIELVPEAAQQVDRVIRGK